MGIGRGRYGYELNWTSGPEGWTSVGGRAMWMDFRMEVGRFHRGSACLSWDKCIMEKH